MKVNKHVHFLLQGNCLLCKQTCTFPFTRKLSNLQRILGYVWFACFASTFGLKTHFSLFFFLLSAVKVDFFNHEQCICALFTDPQISLFINFFIKNWSHSTIHLFKNYFATVFFSFQFQFSAVSKRTVTVLV